MLNIILVVLMFMCGFGGYAAPQLPFRYGLGGISPRNGFPATSRPKREVVTPYRAAPASSGRSRAAA